ncbi:MAG: SRPBCC domain-containing protein [bacterium]
MAEIRHLLRIKATPEKVYEAISTQEGLSRWWTTHTRAEPREGSLATFGFNKSATVFKMRIDVLDPTKRVEWTCLGGHPEWQNTNLFFDLHKEDEETVLNFGHLNWKSADGILPLCSFDWAKYLMSLRAFVETGEGQPHIS